MRRFLLIFSLMVTEVTSTPNILIAQAKWQLSPHQPDITLTMTKSCANCHSVPATRLKLHNLTRRGRSEPSEPENQSPLSRWMPPALSQPQNGGRCRDNPSGAATHPPLDTLGLIQSQRWTSTRLSGCAKVGMSGSGFVCVRKHHIVVPAFR